MRHRRGIDLTGGSNDNLPPKPTGIFVPQRDHSATLADLPQWYVVGTQCRRCGPVPHRAGPLRNTGTEMDEQRLHVGDDRR